jgi:hypothetical protein
MTTPVLAASHREAPLIANDPTADITEEVEDDGEKIITGLQKGEQYRFRIAYENSCGRSEYSKVAVTVPCAFPDTGAQQDTEIQIGDLLQKTVKVMKIYSILW